MRSFSLTSTYYMEIWSGPTSDLARDAFDFIVECRDAFRFHHCRPPEDDEWRLAREDVGTSTSTRSISTDPVSS